MYTYWDFREFLCRKPGFVLGLGFQIPTALVTQPMMQRRLNQTELRSMNNQILCRFQTSKQKVPPLHCHYPVVNVILYRNFVVTLDSKISNRCEKY